MPFSPPDRTIAPDKKYTLDLQFCAATFFSNSTPTLEKLALTPARRKMQSNKFQPYSYIPSPLFFFYL